MSFWDILLGNAQADASRSAAQDQYKKQVAAAASNRQAGAAYDERMSNLSQLFKPYADAGGSALDMLLAGLGLGGDQQAFTNAYRGLPGYQAGLDRGTNAVLANRAASGSLNSGGALKALQRFGSDYEDQRVGDYLSRLYGLAGTGQSATGQMVSTAGQGALGRLNANLGAGQMMYGAAPTIGQGDIAAADAQTAGAQNLVNTAMTGLGYLSGNFGSSFGQPKPMNIGNRGGTGGILGGLY